MVSLSVLEAHHRLQQEGCDRRLRLCLPGLHPVTSELCCQTLGQALRGGKWGGKSNVTRSAAIKTCSGRFYQRHHELPVLFLDVLVFQVSPASFHLCPPHSSPGDRGWHCNVWGDGKATFNCVDSVGRSFGEGAGCTETQPSPLCQELQHTPGRRVWGEVALWWSARLSVKDDSQQGGLFGAPE